MIVETYRLGKCIFFSKHFQSEYEHLQSFLNHFANSPLAGLAKHNTSKMEIHQTDSKP